MISDSLPVHPLNFCTQLMFSHSPLLLQVLTRVAPTMAAVPTCASSRPEVPPSPAPAPTPSSWPPTTRPVSLTVPRASSGVGSLTTAVSLLCGSVMGRMIVRMVPMNLTIVVSDLILIFSLHTQETIMLPTLC